MAISTVATLVVAGCIVVGVAPCAVAVDVSKDIIDSRNDKAQVGTVNNKNTTTAWDIKTNASDKIDYNINGSKVSAFQDPNTKLYWARDTEGHGGSAYKVFEKQGDQLIWKADADQYGNYITGKYKGNIGMKIKVK